MSITDKQTNMTAEEAIKVLQEDGCVDCIHETEGYAKCEFEGNCKVRTAMNTAIEALKQKPKTGHWIKIVVNGQHKLRCDKCDYVEPEYRTYIRNYCPNCGAIMVESEESEGRK